MLLLVNQAAVQWGGALGRRALVSCNTRKQGLLNAPSSATPPSPPPHVGFGSVLFSHWRVRVLGYFCVYFSVAACAWPVLGSAGTSNPRRDLQPRQSASVRVGRWRRRRLLGAPAVPRQGHRLRAVPDVSNAVPDVSNAVPDVSNAVPDVSSTGTCRYTCCTCKSRDYFRVMPGAKITMIAHVYPLQWDSLSVVVADVMKACSETPTRTLS